MIRSIKLLNLKAGKKLAESLLRTRTANGSVLSGGGKILYQNIFKRDLFVFLSEK